MPGSALRIATLAALTLTAACARAPHVPTRDEIYNAWKDDCYKLSDLYKEKLRIVPYHMIANRNADRCSSPDPEFRWEPDSRNMYILVANLFYHYDFDVQTRALDLLESYHCEDDHNCPELAALLDTHIRATLATQSPRWREALHPRIRDFWRYLKTK